MMTLHTRTMVVVDKSRNLSLPANRRNLVLLHEQQRLVQHRLNSNVPSNVPSNDRPQPGRILLERRHLRSDNNRKPR